MGYTRDEIINRCKVAFENKSIFYKKDFVNYRGVTTDTKEYYTEVIAEFLCDNIDEYISGIKCISRVSSYKTAGHDGKYDPTTNRIEEQIAMQMFNQCKEQGSFAYIGNIEDYQTPLKSNAGDKEVGKIDLLAYNGKEMIILELKKPDSKETMLRCVLEAFTYIKIVDKYKLVSDFGYDFDKISVKASPFVFYKEEQYNEMQQDRPNLKMLMKLLDSKPYYIIKENKYIVVE